MTEKPKKPYILFHVTNSTSNSELYEARVREAKETEDVFFRSERVDFFAACILFAPGGEIGDCRAQVGSTVADSAFYARLAYERAAAGRG